MLKGKMKEMKIMLKRKIAAVSHKVETKSVVMKMVEMKRKLVDMMKRKMVVMKMVVMMKVEGMKRKITMVRC
uniref:Uncharacterized protein n=1 Tax=Arcella intermedia TaxID=1963864 RepID=A0A6B2LWD2_9EUKA